MVAIYIGDIQLELGRRASQEEGEFKREESHGGSQIVVNFK
jgi:hypothetical protein